EYMPRKGRSKYPDTSKVNEEELIENVVPAFAPETCFARWTDFEKSFTEYKRMHNLRFRVRSSETTQQYNKYG
ncbi:hypothetical protein PHYSODRAFT_415448, partial [Phytophthora sojae]